MDFDQFVDILLKNIDDKGVLKPTKEVIKAIREYTLELAKNLEKASENDYLVCSFYVPDIVNKALEGTGFRHVETKCAICGAEVYALNVKTSAKPICPDCFLRKMFHPVPGG